MGSCENCGEPTAGKAKCCGRKCYKTLWQRRMRKGMLVPKRVRLAPSKEPRCSDETADAIMAILETDAGVARIGEAKEWCYGRLEVNGPDLIPKMGSGVAQGVAAKDLKRRLQSDR